MQPKFGLNMIKPHVYFGKLFVKFIGGLFEKGWIYQKAFDNFFVSENWTICLGRVQKVAFLHNVQSLMNGLIDRSGSRDKVIQNEEI